MGLTTLATGTIAAQAGEDRAADPLRDPLHDPLTAPEPASDAEDSVQMAGGDGKSGVKSVAAQGAKGNAGSLPYASRIQQAFGHHDISGIKAFTDDKAEKATSALGAEAYAMGSKVVFSPGGQSLHIAAHEAAHVIQQQAGLKPPGGVGSPGDPLEQHAEQVADAVEAGDDDGAVQLLDSVSKK